MNSPCHSDPFGHVLLDVLEGRAAREIVERSDGYMYCSEHDARTYFAPYEDWPVHQKRAADHAFGRVLDVGCGAGRVALNLQERGLDCVSIDASPLAVEVAKRRGVRHVEACAFADVGRQFGAFDTVIMLGNNFGLFGSWRAGRRLLRSLSCIVRAGGQIVAETSDPHVAHSFCHAEYRERNRRLGRFPGQLRVRIRYREHRGPWFDYLLVSVAEMQALVWGTGWTVEEIVASETAAYTAMLRRVEVHGW